MPTAVQRREAYLAVDGIDELVFDNALVAKFGWVFWDIFLLFKVFDLDWEYSSSISSQSQIKRTNFSLHKYLLPCVFDIAFKYIIISFRCLEIKTISQYRHTLIALPNNYQQAAFVINLYNHKLFLGFLQYDRVLHVIRQNHSFVLVDHDTNWTALRAFIDDLYLVFDITWRQLEDDSGIGCLFMGLWDGWCHIFCTILVVWIREFDLGILHLCGWSKTNHHNQLHILHRVLIEECCIFPTLNHRWCDHPILKLQPALASCIPDSVVAIFIWLFDSQVDAFELDVQSQRIVVVDWTGLFGGTRW